MLWLYWLNDFLTENIQTDNGSEFLGYFNKTCKKLNINQEFLNQGNFNLDLQKFNHNLYKWLIEYNFRRPHQALGYVPPINFQAKYLKVLPMYLSNTLV